MGARAVAGQRPGNGLVAGDPAGAGGGEVGFGVKQVLWFCAALVLMLSGVVAVKAEEPADGGLSAAPYCWLIGADAKARIECQKLEAELVFKGGVPVRLWLPEPRDGGRNEYFLLAIPMKESTIDWVYSRLSMALAACESTEGCRDVAPKIRAEFAFGCSERPRVYQVSSILRYDGEESPILPFGHAFLCRNATKVLMVFISPFSETLRGGEVPEAVQMDVLNVAAFPLSE